MDKFVLDEYRPYRRTCAYRWPVCLACDLPGIHTVAMLRSALKAADPAEVMVGHADELRARVAGKCQHEHPDAVVWVEGALMEGPRRLSTMANELAAIAAPLAQPVARYDGDQLPPSEKIQGALAKLVGEQLFDSKTMPASRKRRVGGGGNRLHESRGVQLARPTLFRSRRAHGDLHFEVVVTSGMNLVENLRYALDLCLWRLRERSVGPAGAKDPNDGLMEDLGWQLFGRYVNLMAHLPEYAPLVETPVSRAGLPALASVVAALPLGDARPQVMGDLAVLQFDIHKRTALAPGIKSYAELFLVLQEWCYPRLAAVTTSDHGQKLAKLVKVIAQDMDRAIIARIDWSPLVGAYLARRANLAT